MSEIATLDGIGKLIVGQLLGSSTTSADAANSIKNATKASPNTVDNVANNVVAGSDVAGIAASNTQIFQQFATGSAEAGMLAGRLATSAGFIGVAANVLMISNTAMEKGVSQVDTNSIVSTIGAILATSTTLALAPEVAIVLGVAAAGFTVAGLLDLGTVGSNVSALQNALNTMSSADLSGILCAGSEFHS